MFIFIITLSFHILFALASAAIIVVSYKIGSIPLLIFSSICAVCGLFLVVFDIIELVKERRIEREIKRDRERYYANEDL